MAVKANIYRYTWCSVCNAAQMAVFLFAAGSFGFALCALRPELMDRVCRRGAGAVLTRLRLLLAPAQTEDQDLALCSRLVAATRAGISLDPALSSLLKESDHSSLRDRIRRIMDRKPPSDFLSIYLSSALESGMPILATLQIFQRALNSRRKMQWKARALTSQARAQAEVLSWLPWSLALAIFCVDAEWFFTSSHQPLTWFFWALAFALTGAGRAWMKRALARALRPRSPEEKMEENLLPDLALRMMSEISTGRDAESSLERALQAIASPELNAAFAGGTNRSEKARQLRSLLQYAAQTGAPLRDDLTAFVHDIYAELESRWEERVQKLPVVLLAPLFLCFFPSTLLVLAGFVLPLLQEFR